MVVVSAAFWRRWGWRTLGELSWFTMIISYRLSFCWCFIVAFRLSKGFSIIARLFNWWGVDYWSNALSYLFYMFYWSFQSDSLLRRFFLVLLFNIQNLICFDCFLSSRFLRRKCCAVTVRRRPRLISHPRCCYRSCCRSKRRPWCCWMKRDNSIVMIYNVTLCIWGLFVSPVLL